MNSAQKWAVWCVYVCVCDHSFGANLFHISKSDCGNTVEHIFTPGLGSLPSLCIEYCPPYSLLTIFRPLIKHHLS